MKLATMFQDVIGSALRKPATQLYPYEKLPTPERYRGKLSFSPVACTGCALCVKDCPSQAIHLTILDRAAKRYVMQYHVDRCTYCGQCVVSCKFKCIALSSTDWEQAALETASFNIYYGKDEDVQQVLAGPARPAVESKPE